LQRLFYWGRAFATFENVTWNLGKAIGESIHVAPIKLASVRCANAVNALQSPISNGNIVSLATSRLTIHLGEPTDTKLLHDVI
jgi:hypothetical protein